MNQKRTKIVCTIGPASSAAGTLTKMVRAGMNVARLNMSHGTLGNHRLLISRVRAVSRKLGEPIAILQDLQGPKIRVGLLPKEGLPLRAGELVTFTTNVTKEGSPREAGRIPVTYARLHREIHPGHRMFLDDGLIEARAYAVKGTEVSAEVVVGGTLTSHKGLNLPDTDIRVSAMTSKDRTDVRFGLKQGVDYIALSFVRTARDVVQLRKMIVSSRRLLSSRAQLPRIVVKIEKPQALKNFSAILEVTDAVMIARGDLAVETPAEHVPVSQKEIIAACRAEGKPVIVATQMLDSMIRNPRPTRAEVSDVANAVFDHADAVMLSGESATGKYPVEAVSMMARVIREAEASRYDDVPLGPQLGKTKTIREAMAAAGLVAAERGRGTAIVAASWSGETGRMLAKYRAELPLLVGSPSPTVVRQLNLSWGVAAFLIPSVRDTDALLRALLAGAKRTGVLRKGEPIVVISGSRTGAGGGANLVGIRTI